jgi:hypothetical protein
VAGSEIGIGDLGSGMRGEGFGFGVLGFMVGGRGSFTRAIDVCEISRGSSRGHRNEATLRATQGQIFKSISHRCYLFEVAFAWELTSETIVLPVGCIQGGEEI